MQIILPHNTEIFEEQLNHAAEELSIGDSDDPHSARNWPLRQNLPDRGEHPHPSIASNQRVNSESIMLWTASRLADCRANKELERDVKDSDSFSSTSLPGPQCKRVVPLGTINAN